jgi:transposase
MPRPIARIDLTDEQHQSLTELATRPTTPQRAALRARIILGCAQGLSQVAIAAQQGVRRRIVSKWCRRFQRRGLAGLTDAPGRGRKPSLPEEQRARVLTMATQPPPGYTRWSVRRMAEATGLSVGTVHGLWQANDIKPHLTRTFKLSKDKDFERKFWDVIALYLDPPDKALVLCCDEKSQCQAMERTQPPLPLGRGRVKTCTHDYIRHGTLTLFAALNYLDGKILSQTAPRHTHRQWLAFLKHLDAQTPAELTLHLIIDNYGTHKAPKVKSWVKWRNARQQQQHGADRLVMHFTPTSSSWMNLVERFFRDLSEDAIREGSFTSVRELGSAIEEYLAQRNLAPRRYVWKKKGEEILAQIQRARATLETQVATRTL